jgi:hypothetical protein
VTVWEREPDEWARIEPHATLFVQTHFLAHEKYPDGIADMVGYWAEDRIIGGVLLFDRSQAWSDDENPEPNAYIHPNRDKVTFRICQLLDDQQSRLLDFLTSEDGPATTETQDGPLPMLPNLTNRVRVDQIDAIPVHQIYRDLWERVDPPEPRSVSQSIRRCDRRIELDYPEMESYEELQQRIKEASRRSPLPY